MPAPIIGITSFSLELPCERSAVNQAYVQAIVAAGGTPICLPIGLDDAGIQRVYGLIDGLLLPGGDDVAPHRYGHDAHSELGQVDEARDHLELSLTRMALRDDLPVLGVCRGIQLLAVAAGGTLYQDLPSQVTSHLRHEVREFGRDHLPHDVTVEPHSLLSRALGTTKVKVNSFHHQAVLDVPDEFVITARADDGVVEAIEAPRLRFAVGVQCHPEELWRQNVPEFAGLFRAFVEAVQARHSAAA